ncbi:Uncharacterised protein [uncultured archaeon]|nr:Uncharacterised protein [uncultured archaeon]
MKTENKYKQRSFLHMNQRGQAALVDSLFFIAIVATICTGLFYFAVNYGLGTENLLNSFYSTDFAMDSLKVITYINVMRDGSAVIVGNPSSSSLSTLSTSSPAGSKEYDYLLALIKEDFSKNKKLGTQTKIAIANTLYSVLKPFDDSVDYAFYISRESTVQGSSTYLALILSTHKFYGYGMVPVTINGVTTDRNGPLVRRVFYSCEPTNNKALEKNVFPYVGQIDSALGKITLGTGLGNTSPYIIGLHVWVSKQVGVLQDPTAVGSELGCTILNPLSPTLPNISDLEP